MSVIYNKEIKINNEVVIEVKDNKKVFVKGSNAELFKDFSHARNITIKKEKDTIIVQGLNNKKKSRSIVGTISSHIKNMVKGSIADFTVIQKIVYAHFPINVRVEDDNVYIENFLGERSPRVSKIYGDKTKVEVSGDDVIVSGPNIEQVTQTAANITKKTKIKDKDPRVFQDGIFKFKKLYADTILWELKL